MDAPIGKLEALVRRAVKSAWPQLKDEDVAALGLDVDALAALLHRDAGYDKETARSEARAAIASAIHPPTGGNAGWAEIFSEGDEQRLGRGQVMLFDTTPDSDGKDLAGTVTGIRLEDGADPLSAGTYIIRFEENGETRHVAAVLAQDAVASDTIVIAMLEDGLPISIRELSAGE